ncbi:MAG: hypothetical protein IPN67_11585 [Bacteroidales bacterium]|nr:hypothetical protein [Bacteroidales bacterium]MBK8882993.1 hypothetical protein [Bacteroidales bacterium]
MKNLIFLLTATLVFTFCKGPGSGPLVKDSFDKKEQTPAMGGSDKHMARVMTSKADVKIEPCADCITIAKLLADKKAYDGKVIKVKGQVTKYNGGIMGKNWVHIQDGTENQEGFDLTITTDITVSVGETVTFEGKIALDKDFGYGYSYNVIMEEGKSVQ